MNSQKTFPFRFYGPVKHGDYTYNQQDSHSPTGGSGVSERVHLNPVPIRKSRWEATSPNPPFGSLSSLELGINDAPCVV